MIFAFVIIGFSVVIQLLCMLKGKKVITKILPLLFGLLLIVIPLALMARSFSMPSPADNAEFYRQENQFADLFCCFCIGCLDLAVVVLGWLVYGIILFLRRKRNYD